MLVSSASSHDPRYVLSNVVLPRQDDAGRRSRGGEPAPLGAALLRDRPTPGATETRGGARHGHFSRGGTEERRFFITLC